MKALGFGYSSRQGAKTQSFWNFLLLTSRLCVFAGNIANSVACSLAAWGKLFFTATFQDGNFAI